MNGTRRYDVIFYLFGLEYFPRFQIYSGADSPASYVVGISRFFSGDSQVSVGYLRGGNLVVYDHYSYGKSGVFVKFAEGSVVLQIFRYIIRNLSGPQKIYEGFFFHFLVIHANSAVSVLQLKEAFSVGAFAGF